MIEPNIHPGKIFVKSVASLDVINFLLVSVPAGDPTTTSIHQ